jgi:para-nitrobenzyl esterase
MKTRLCVLSLVAVGSLACGGASVAPDASADVAVVGDVASGGDSGGGGCAILAPTDPDAVATDRGAIRGTTDGDVRVFLGVPYAAPPVGALRFRAPQDVACWGDVRDATRFGAVCPQLDETSNAIGSEDCLTLNVFAPSARPSTALPVLFFIHGGGNNQGSASILTAATGGRGYYDGRSLARRGAVVVTIQYRLGALGFLSHDALDRESPTTPSGAQGLRDQLLALQWVQRNIRVFGGDPSKVMVFGESAGALDTMLLVTSPRAAGLFSRALSQSGGVAAPTQATARAVGQRLVTAASCAGAADAIQCLRDKTAAEVLLAIPQQVTGITANDFAPSIDGDVLPESPIERIRAGRHNRVALVYGTNSEETARMVPPAAMVATEADFDRLARAYLSQYALGAAQVSAVLALYAPAMFSSPHEALVALTTDTRWTCPGRGTLRALAGAQREPLFRYFFTHRLDARLAPMQSAAGAFHGLELGYVFGTVDGLAGYRATAADRAVIDAVQSSWVRFATTGTLVDSGSSPAWPAYDAARDPYLELANPTAAREGVRSARCDGIERALIGG